MIVRLGNTRVLLLISSFGRAYGTVLRRNSLLIFRRGGRRVKLESARKKKLDGRQAGRTAEGGRDEEKVG